MLHLSRNDETQPTSRISHSDPSRDMSSVVTVLAMLCSLLSDSARVRSNSMRPNFEWIINCLTRVWQILEPADDQIISKATRRSCFSSFLKALRTCLVPSRLVKFDVFESVQAATLVCQSICHFLHPLFEDMSSDLEREICRSMGDLLSCGKKLPPVLQVYNEHLGPSLEAVDGPCSRMENFGDDLQVCIGSSIIVFSDSVSVLWH